MKFFGITAVLITAILSVPQKSSAQCMGNMVIVDFTCVCGETVSITKCRGDDPAGNCQPNAGRLQPCGGNCAALQGGQCGGSGGITKLHLKEFDNLLTPQFFNLNFSASLVKGFPELIASCGGNDQLVFDDWLRIKLEAKPVQYPINHP